MKHLFIFIIGIVITSCTGSLFEKQLFEKSLSDGSIIRGISYQNLPASNDVIWILRKTSTGKCYITGKIEIGYIDNIFEISEIEQSRVTIRVADTLNMKGMYVDFAISFKGTFCFNEDCKKYPAKWN